MKKATLVFIPSPGMGHLIPTVELAKLMVNHNDHLSIICLIIETSSDSRVAGYKESFSSSTISNRLQFIKLPCELTSSEKPDKFNSGLINSQKPRVKEIATEHQKNPDSPRLAGFVVDMFCSSMMEVANELKVPTYLYFTSSVSFLGLLFHVKTLHDDQNVDVTLLKGSETELDVPGLMNRLPAKVLPSAMTNIDWLPFVLADARIFGKTKGIIVNTFMELEPYAVNSFLNSQVPPVYPIGPVLNLNSETEEKVDDSGIMNWLDDQPPSSVVFLCFGSMGSFGVDQLKEIASALESSTQRFIWSLRRSPPMDAGHEAPTEYTNHEEVLPKGFLERTANVGRIVGWAPQVAILSHPSVGGFVSHCGWNSVLESLWFGVPIAAWPMYAEQQFNAFELVVELGLAVEIKMDYRRSFIDNKETIVGAQEIEIGIRGVMEKDSEMRVKVKKISEASRSALMKGGSSYSFLDRFICNVFDNNV